MLTFLMKLLWVLNRADHWIEAIHYQSIQYCPGDLRPLKLTDYIQIKISTLGMTHPMKVMYHIQTSIPTNTCSFFSESLSLSFYLDLAQQSSSA